MIEPRNENTIEITISRLLLWGTVLSAVVIAVGGLGYLVAEGGNKPHDATFKGEPSDLRSIHGILTDALALNPGGVIQLGLLLLIATPIARVVAALVAFALARDRAFVLICSFVLAALLYGLLVS